MEKNKNELNEYQKINKRRRVQIYINEPSLTQQSLEGETNINNIVKKYKQTGELPPTKQGFYGDVSNIPSYQQAVDIVRVGDTAFRSLPAKVRAEFNNDPGAMIEWLQNEQNRPRAIELGLIEGDTSIKPQSPEIQKKDDKKDDKKE